MKVKEVRRNKRGDLEAKFMRKKKRKKRKGGLTLGELEVEEAAKVDNVCLF